MSDVRRVAADVVRPLRHRVLRPMQDADAVTYPGDADPRAFHGAVLGEDGAVLGVVSVCPEPHPRAQEPGDWRLRGMATAPEARGRGLGAALLDASLAHVRAEGGTRVWCNARERAVTLYARRGFATEGERFEIDPIGPHFVMSLEL